MKLKWIESVYEIRELNAKEYLEIEKIVRDAKDFPSDVPLEMEPGDFSIGLIVASVKLNDEKLAWGQVVEMPAKLFQALSNRTNELNVLSPKEERSLFFESSTEGNV